MIYLARNLCLHILMNMGQLLFPLHFLPNDLLLFPFVILVMADFPFERIDLLLIHLFDVD